jgi:menaquinone-specific isochorismate synthase
VTPTSSSPPAFPALSGRAVELDPGRRAHLAPRPAPLPVPRFSFEAPSGERIQASGCVARLRTNGESPLESARSWLSTVASTARFVGGDSGASLVALVVFPFDAGHATHSNRDRHAWIPARIERRDASGRVTGIEWHTDDEDAGMASEAAHDGPVPEQDFTREAWTRAVEAALERIRSESLRKVVLARSRRVRGSEPFDADRILDALRDAYPACYRFRYEPGDGSIFLGASPERLVALRGGTIEADAVAGTAAGEGRELLDDRKERLEHDIVVEEVVRALRPVAESVEADDIPSVQRLRNVTHLRTRVRASARPGAHVLDLAARIHPSPAVAGAPREAALDLIRSLEPRPRGWYAGPIGWASAAGEGELTLGLRAALLRGSEALLHAGAGIVLGSDPDREWDECESKMRAMEEALRG